jgi:hypothetical protein
MIGYECESRKGLGKMAHTALFVQQIFATFDYDADNQECLGTVGFIWRGKNTEVTFYKSKSAVLLIDGEPGTRNYLLDKTIKNCAVRLKELRAPVPTDAECMIHFSKPPVVPAPYKGMTPLKLDYQKVNGLIIVRLTDLKIGWSFHFNKDQSTVVIKRFNEPILPKGGKISPRVFSYLNRARYELIYGVVTRRVSVHTY